MAADVGVDLCVAVGVGQSALHAACERVMRGGLTTAGPERTAIKALEEVMACGGLLRGVARMGPAPWHNAALNTRADGAQSPRRCLGSAATRRLNQICMVLPA